MFPPGTLLGYSMPTMQKVRFRVTALHEEDNTSDIHVEVTGDGFERVGQSWTGVDMSEGNWVVYERPDDPNGVP